MFPSSDLFTQLNCYLFDRKLCTRPHCVFKHHTETQNLKESEETTDECTQELERINREIECVKHQVEVEQRRLSHYQIKSTSSNTTNCYEPGVISKNVQDSSSVETNTQSKKYTVDSSKPKTDLEYDPLSNFSSDLRSYCSSKREHKSRNEHSSESVQLVTKTMPNVMNDSQSKKLFQDHIDSNEEDDVLIIDLPLSPTKTDEARLVRVDPPQDIVCSLAATNTSGHDEIETKYKDNVNYKPSQSSSTCNNSISNDENIFVKMAQHMSNYNPLKIMQPSDMQNNAMFNEKDSPTAAIPVKNTLTNQAEKPPSESMTNAPAKMKELQQLVLDGSLCEPKDVLSAAQWTQNAFLQSTVVKQVHAKEADDVVLESSSDELNYSDMEVSESDPDEECYRIFMEANGEEQEPSPEVASNAEPIKNIILQPQAFSAKKRIAHESKVPEVVSYVRPQPQVLVPLRASVSSTFSSQSPALPLIRKVEQRASMITASIKAGQALHRVQSDTKRAQNTPCSIATKPALSISPLPLGATVIDVGNNLHLVLPEGTFPMSDTSGMVSSVLTPITPVNANPITIKPTYQSAATQQRRTVQPVIIPPQARKSVSAAAATSANPCSPAQVSVVKSVCNKRKLKQKCETVKVPHDIRQSYVNKFTEEFLKSTANINEAFGKALDEERTVYNRSANKLKYLSVAVNALKRLRNQSGSALEEKHQTVKKTKGYIPLNPSLLNGEGVMLLYECLQEYVLTDEMLIGSNFPFQNPEKPGTAIIFADKKSISDPLRKLCCRCGATYSVSQTGKHTRKEECTYHYGRGVENKVPGGVETRYSCCEGVMGSPGCQVFKLHVCDSLSMDGFVTTAPRDPTDTKCPGVYAVDCEKCYTINGLELSRVTVVSSSLQIVYDTFVKPNNEVIDYNTRFSGICEEDMKRHCHSLKEVQKNLLSFLSADTILIGHGLETNLCLLKVNINKIQAVYDVSLTFSPTLIK